MSLLQVTDLRVTFPTDTEDVAAVRGVDFHVDSGEVLAIVGESGSGKSASAMALIGLLPEYADVSGSVRLDGNELIGLDDAGMSAIRGARIGTVFQDPMSALTPVYAVGGQIAEALRTHQKGLSRQTPARGLSNCSTSSASCPPSSARGRSRINCRAASASAS